jgi:uncharacterized membrane protein
MMDVFMDVLRQMVPLLGGVLTAILTWRTHLLSGLHTAMHLGAYTLQVVAMFLLVVTLVVWSCAAWGITWLSMTMARIAQKL